ARRPGGRRSRALSDWAVRFRPGRCAASFAKPRREIAFDMASASSGEPVRAVNGYFYSHAFAESSSAWREGGGALDELVGGLLSPNACCRARQTSAYGRLSTRGLAPPQPFFPQNVPFDGSGSFEPPQVAVRFSNQVRRAVLRHGCGLFPRGARSSASMRGSTPRPSRSGCVDQHVKGSAHCTPVGLFRLRYQVRPCDGAARLAG